MKALIAIAVLVASITVSAAQNPTLPMTKNLVDDSGKKIGTATTWAGVTVFRNEKEEILGSSSINGSTVTFKDPDGKITRTMEYSNDGSIIFRNSAGEIINTIKVSREPK